MQRTYERILVSIICSFFLIAAPAIALGAQSVIADESTVPDRALIPSGAIRVNDDAELAAVADSGSGTSGDPYVIEDLRINATGEFTGIFIGNTTAHLVIRNCNISGPAGDFWDEFKRGDAIMLYQTSNVVVEDCVGYGCTYGIDIFSSHNIGIRNCDFYSLQYVGIIVSSSHEVVIENNTMLSMSTGIACQIDSYEVEIRNNNASGCINGLVAYQSTNIEVHDNDFSGNSDNGIVMGSGTQYCWITNNTCNYNDDSGIDLGSVTDVVVDGNDVIGNGYYGIFLGTNDHITVQNNRVMGTETRYGLVLGNSDHCLIYDNFIAETNEVGIHLFSSENNTIENNTISDIFRSIYLTSGGSGNNHNLFANNTLRNGSAGMYFYETNARFNTILNNLFSGFTNPGLNVDGGVFYQTQIIYNTFSDISWTAISLDSSATGNRIYGNAFIECGYIFPSICTDSGSNMWNSTDTGNYWHGHTTPDADEDGIVDVSYAIGGGSNEDHYPLISPLMIASPQENEEIASENATVSGTLINNHEAASFQWENDATGDAGNITAGLEWIGEVPLAPGENLITVTLMDSGGRVFSESVTVICTALFISCDPANGSLTYTAETSIDVIVDAVSYPGLLDIDVVLVSAHWDLGYRLGADPMGAMTYHGVFTMDLYDGLNRIIVFVNDTAGHMRTCSLEVFMDVYPPAIEFTDLPEGSYLNDDPVEISWTFVQEPPTIPDSPIAECYYSMDGADWTRTYNASAVFPGLSDGGHYFRIKGVDMAGNAGVKGVNFTLDTNAPELEITSPAEGTVFGWNDVTVDYVAYDALTGLDHLQYRLDGGDWTDFGGLNITFADLADGVHTVEMRTADMAGNTNSTSVSFTVDTTAPVVIITAPAEDSYVKNGAVSWSVDDLSGADLTEVSTDGVSWTAVSGTSHTFVLADGTHTVHVRVTDQVGLVGTDDVTFTIDTTAPTLSITSPADGSYNNTGSMMVRWTASDANGISKTEVSKDGNLWTTVSGSSATVSGLSDGPWTIYVRVTDPAGNTVTENVQVTVSISGPVVELLPDDTVCTRDTLVQITANLSDAVPLTGAMLQVFVGGEMVSEVDLSDQVLGDVTASLSHAVELTEGVNVIRLTVNDSAGNSVTVEVTVVMDTVAPTLVIDFPAEGALLNYTAGIAMWTASDNENGSGLNNTWAKTDNDAWMEIGSAEGWIFAVTGDGEHTLYVRIDDQAGNVVERNVTFLVDTAAPTAEVSPIGDDLELDSLVVIEFSEQMNVTSVSIIVEGITGNVTWEGNMLTFTPSALEYAHEYRLTLSGKDLAGNYMEMNWTFTTLAATGSISGTLVDEGGNPLANITVRVGDVTGVTDELGRFILNGLTAASYVITIDAEGFEMFTGTITVISGQTLELGEMTLVSEGEDEGSDIDSGILLIVAVVAFIAVAGVATMVFLKRRP